MPDSSPDASLSELIASGTSVSKALRIYAGLSLEELVDVSGISRMRMLEIEGGSQPTFDEVRRISAALDRSKSFARG